MRFASRAVLVVLTFISCVGCDQFAKAMAREHIAVGETHSYFHDTFRLTHAENPGAFLSLGAKLPEKVRVMLFSVAVMGIALLALAGALFMRHIGHHQIVGLTLIAAGGFGNWIDRVVHAGHVTDFMNVGVGSLRTGIFNVADMVLMAGVGLYLFALAGQPSREAAEKTVEKG